ncbi:MAG: hypothetical protein JRG73_14420 [Deltaproteobacteria bacterium]|nr:hypothetical protein [Deltaproteobacteria bacterium]
MTHAVHRMGTPESLARDYNLLAMVARKVDGVDAVAKLQEFLRIVQRVGAVNTGVSRRGSRFVKTDDEVERAITAHSTVHATFDSEEKLCQAVEEVKKADLGVSVTAHGLFDGLERCCRKNGLSFHTVALSIGLVGPEDLVPDPDILAISTMCGHGYVTFNLARKALDDVAAGRRNMDEVCKELARPCLCGIFNPIRAREILLSRTAD